MACNIPDTYTPKQAWIFSNHENRRREGKGIGAVNARRGLARALLPDGVEPCLIQNTIPCNPDTTVQDKLEYADNYIKKMLEIYPEPDFVVTGWGDLEATKMTLALKKYCPDVKIIFIGAQKHLDTITQAERDHLDLILCPDFLTVDGAALPDRRMRHIRYIPHHLVRDVPTHLPQHVEEWIAEQNHQQFTLLMIGAPDHENYNEKQEEFAAAIIMGQVDNILATDYGVMISSSPRTPRGLIQKIKEDYLFNDRVLCYEFQAKDPNNPYPAVLKHPGLHSVGFTPDTISMPCEALIAGVPLFIIDGGYYWCDNHSVQDCLTQMMRDDLILHLSQVAKGEAKYPAKRQPFCTSSHAAGIVRQFFGWTAPVFDKRYTP